MQVRTFFKKGFNPFLYEHIGKRSKDIEGALSTQLKKNEDQ